MTDKELLQALEPLKDKIEQFTATASGSLSPDEVQLMKVLYPELQERAMNQLPRVFNASCGSCIRETFGIYCSWYQRESERINHEELLDDMIRDEIKKQDVDPVVQVKKKGRTKK